MNGMGFGLYGWMHDPAIPGKFVKIYFFTFLWLPFSLEDIYTLHQRID